MKLVGEIEMFIHSSLKTPWINGGEKPIMWEKELKLNQTPEDCIKENFKNGMERLVNWKVVE